MNDHVERQSNDRIATHLAVILAFLALTSACSGSTRSSGAQDGPSVGSSGSVSGSTAVVVAEDSDEGLSSEEIPSEGIGSTEPRDGSVDPHSTSGEDEGGGEGDSTAVTLGSAAVEPAGDDSSENTAPSTTTPSASDSAPSPSTETTQAGDGILLAVLIIATDGDLDRAVAEGLITEADIEAALEAIASGDLDSYIEDP